MQYFLTFLFSEALLNSKRNKDKVQLFAPIWLEEIQNNKIYKKYSERNQKIDEEKAQENETEKSLDENRGEKDGSGKEEKDVTEEKENSKTESDQDCWLLLLFNDDCSFYEMIYNSISLVSVND